MAANLLCCCYCAAILVYCSVRDLTRFCYVIGFKIIRIHLSTRYRIRCGFIFSHSGERIKNTRIHWWIRQMLVNGSRIRKEKVANLKLGNIREYSPIFKIARVLKKDLKDNKHNSLHLGAKICSDVCPWTLSVPCKAHSFTRAMLSENSSLLGADDVRGQISWHK